MIKMAVKAKEEEAGVLSMVELLSSPHDQLLVLQPGAGPVPQQSYEGDDVGEVDYLSMYRPLSKLAGGLLAKMIYSGRQLVVGLAFSATSKYIELGLK